MSELTDIGLRARAAAEKLGLISNEKRNAALKYAAKKLIEKTDEIIKANLKDVENARKDGNTEAFIDRLSLDAVRIASIAQGMTEVAEQPDCLGEVISSKVLKNGMFLEKVSVNIGVLAVIFESRPNVSADAAAIALKSGNSVILRGGKEAICSNIAIVGAIRGAYGEFGLPEDCVNLIEDTSRESANALMKLNGYVDVLIPRGGKSLIETVLANSTVPVIATGAGTCHTYVEKSADIAMAADIIFNAKTSRPSVCNACECILIDAEIAKEALPVIAERLKTKNVEIRADEYAYDILGPGLSQRATEDDWGKEYNDYIIAVKTVKNIDEALDFISRYSTKHSECIVTRDKESAEKFLTHVDAAAVYHNVSTRFTDGGEFGLGAEIGISTQKLHARGPLGARELTTYKYIIRGNGQVR